MENDREIDKILMNIRGTTGGVVAVSLISARLALTTLIFLMRMVKKGLLAASAANNFKAFMEKTEGNYTIYNIPLSAGRAEKLKEIGDLELKLQDAKDSSVRASLRKQISNLEKELPPVQLNNPGSNIPVSSETAEKLREIDDLKQKLRDTKKVFGRVSLRRQISSLKKELPEVEQLNKLGINFCVLPKLNGSSQTIQVAVDNKNEQMFKNWFLNHLTAELNGGVKEMEDIKVLTEGNYSIFNLPFEGQELQEVLPDFNILGINYAILPDLKVGDGNSQIAIPNADRSKLEVWFKMWKDKQVKDGKESGEMYAMDQSSYMSTAALEPEDYTQTADEVYKEANAEFEKQAVNVPWKPEMQKENCEEYVRLLNDKNYERITLNAERLQRMDPVDKAAEMEKNGYFITRVPYTKGDGQLILAVPENRVFIGDEEKTFITFLPKNRKTLFIDSKGNVEARNFDDAYKLYDKVTRKMKQIESLKKGAPLPEKNRLKNPVKDAALKNVSAPVIPQMPKTPKL